MAYFVEDGLIVDGIFYSFNLPSVEFQEIMHQIRIRSERLKINYAYSK